MPISIHPPARNRAPDFDTTFALQQDDWNDYSFQTLYHLYYRSISDPSSPVLIGAVKILRLGQKSSDDRQITEPFEYLGSDFCSVGRSLDYYQRLHDMKAEDREYILKALNDIIRYPALEIQFREEPGWETSLFRDDADPGSFITDAAAMLSGDYAQLATLDQELKFNPADWDATIALNFNAPEAREKGPLTGAFIPRPVSFNLPRRIIVIIGRNGSGKSTLLSKIARVAYASPDERATPEITAIGAFDPPSVGFTRIIAISYSAFDSFIVPGASLTERAQLASDIEHGTGRYVYAGLRDIALEAKEEANQEQVNPALAATGQVSYDSDRKKTTRLKNLSQLAEEFERLVATIHKAGESELLDRALAPVLQDPSFSDLELKSVAALIGESAKDAFHRWSTGHKIVMHVVASLLANTKHRSLVLFDEPESHLHPPLVAALMHAVRIVLERKNAFALVATHSPVVLQETLARHVRVVERVSDNFEVYVPALETFGENVGILTYDTFRLTADATDFHDALDRLVEAYDSIEKIDEFFSPALSGQARAYVMAELAKKSRGS